MLTHIYCKQNNGKSKARILVPSDDGSRNIGKIKYGIFTKSNFHSDKHICHKHKAIGLDKGAFLKHILPNAQQIKCQDKVKQVTYQITVNIFKQFAIEDDLGCGPQLFCPVKYFQIERQTKSEFQIELNLGGSY